MHRHDSARSRVSAATPSAPADHLGRHPMIAVADRLRALSDASELPGEWHNTVMSLRAAADFLIEAAEMIGRGGAGDALPRFPTPERAVECARACIERVHERGAVWLGPRPPL